MEMTGEAHPELRQAAVQQQSEGVHADPYPAKCPITGRPYFMTLEHPELGMVPTYGGPYDSYTIPHLEGVPTQPWHEREMACHRYDHDEGAWLMDVLESVPLRIIHEDELNRLLDAALQQHSPQQGQEQAGQMVSDEQISDRVADAAIDADLPPQWCLDNAAQLNKLARALLSASPVQEGAAPKGIAAAPMDSYSAEDQTFYRFWYGHMLNDLMQPPLANISHATARYIWHAARAIAPPAAQPAAPAMEAPTGGENNA